MVYVQLKLTIFPAKGVIKMEVNIKEKEDSSFAQRARARVRVFVRVTKKKNGAIYIQNCFKMCLTILNIDLCFLE